jgi:hypothetical protein
MKRREEATAALEAQRASRFNPEMERRRKLRAALSKGAEQGLGGFGAGYTAEEERIAGEKLSAAEASVADMDKLIGELRELGMSQFEAEKQARDTVESNVRQGMSTAQAVTTARRQAEDAAETRDVTMRGQDITAATQKYVADKNAGRRTDLTRAIDALKAEAEANGNPISDAEAMRQYFEMQSGIQGVRQRGAAAEQEAAVKARERALERVDLMGADGTAYRQAQQAGKGEEFLNSIINEERASVGLPPLGAAPASTSSSTPLPMPQSAAEAVVGQVYQLPDGSLRRWNGTSLVPVQ